jgi:isorenieratene synthase
MTDSPRPRVVIAGGGIAGLAAAHVLVDAGVAVTVIEKGTSVGGRCFSYVDSDVGFTVEHGIHGVFPRYTNLRKLWADAGIGDAIFSSTATTGMAGADGQMHVTELAKVKGPAPFFLLSMTPRGVLRWRDYLFAARFLVRTYASGAHGDPALDQTTFAAMLAGAGVSSRMADLLLVPYVKNLSYTRADQTSAGVAAAALDYYVVEHADDVKARFFDGGPSALVFEPWRKWLEGRGVTFMFGAPVQQIVVQGGKFSAMSTEAVIRDVDLGPSPRVWTQQVGTQYLALNWVPAQNLLRAYSGHCTHMGCEINADMTAAPPCFACPCHGGRFSADGQVLKGPPAQPLPPVPMQHDAQAGVWIPGTPATSTPPAGPVAGGTVTGDAAVLAMDLASTQSVLPRELAIAPSTRGIPELQTTSVMVLRMRFALQAGLPRWSGPDSGVFPAADFLDNFFALHTFQSEFRALPDLHLECHVGDSQAYAQLADDDVYGQALTVLERYFPKENLSARLDRTKSVVLRHTDVFPLFAPGDATRMPTVSDASRPNLMFAGDWVRPDDPAHRSWFMERAAVTGIEAANALLRSFGRGDHARPIECPPTATISRLLGWPSFVGRAIRDGIRKLLDV